MNKQSELIVKCCVIVAVSAFLIGIGVGHDFKKCINYENSLNSVENFEKLSNQSNMDNFCDAKGYKLGYISWRNKFHCFETTANAEGSGTREKDFEIEDYYYWYFEQ